MRDLESTQQAFVEKCMRWQAGDILARHRDPTRSRFKNARDHVEKSGLSSTIRADQTGDRTLLDRQAGAIYSVKPAEVFV